MKKQILKVLNYLRNISFIFGGSIILAGCVGVGHEKEPGKSIGIALMSFFNGKTMQQHVPGNASYQAVPRTK